MSGKLCARPARTFGYMPCSREVHASGPCAHEPVDVNDTAPTHWTNHDHDHDPDSGPLVTVHNNDTYTGDVGVQPVHSYRLRPLGPVPVVDDVLLCGAGHWRVTGRRLVLDADKQERVVEIMLLCDYEGPNKW